jgi:aspartate/methionine/tyrosine aminotransferase
VRRAAADYLMDGHNQYPPMMGCPELRQAVAEHAKRFQGSTSTGRARCW